MHRFIVKMSWPPEGRSRFGHAYLYLVLADTKEDAVVRVEERWRGKQGGANPHTTLALGTVETDLFELRELPHELRTSR